MLYIRTPILPQLPGLPNLPKRASAAARRLAPSIPVISKKQTPDLDVLIIGAGVSGIDMASHIKRDKLLAKSLNKGRVAIIEKRSDIGGTWDLFKYPGIRSDSDMTTFSFSHHPWLSTKTLADADSIKDYIVEASETDNLTKLIQYNTNVTKLEWSSKFKYWTATLEDVKTGDKRTITSRFVVGATGYYDFDKGYRPTFTGEENFAGQIIHPQQWQEETDYDGKKIVVIGSGATAVTLVPALLDESAPQTASHVTMLQRSPTYIATVPGKSNALNKLQKRLKLSEQAAYKLVRWERILFQQGSYRFAKIAPKALKTLVIFGAKKELKGSDVDIKHFKPTYNPWDQRFCVVPDGDLFKALKTDRADIVTDTIESFTKDGIQLTSGKHLPADIIVSATGLSLQMLGGAEVFIDGEPGAVGERMTYKAVLVENVPNMAVLFGYTNASWTLKIDLACGYIVKLLRHMHNYGYTTVEPTSKATDGEIAKREPDTIMGALTAGYIRRAKDVLPKQGDRYPWYVTNNYYADTIILKYRRITDKWLEFKK